MPANLVGGTQYPEAYSFCPQQSNRAVIRGQRRLIARKARESFRRDERGPARLAHGGLAGPFRHKRYITGVLVRFLVDTYRLTVAMSTLKRNGFGVHYLQHALRLYAPLVPCICELTAARRISPSQCLRKVMMCGSRYLPLGMTFSTDAESATENLTGSDGF